MESLHPSRVLSFERCDGTKNRISLTPGTKSQVRVFWKGQIKHILIIIKINNQGSHSQLLIVANWLREQNRGIVILVEKTLQELPPYMVSYEPSTHEIDLCICIGGDGTLLHLNSLFQGNSITDNGIPPTISFAMGSLGFLTNFDVQSFCSCLEKVLNATSLEYSVPVALRMRLNCEVLQSDSATPCKSIQVLNELVIDRGSSSYLLRLELFVDNDFVSLVRADGLIISTPTGSTAYSMSAGGSMVAPTVSCILITPICPHTLSFRPIILPDTSLIKIRIPETATSDASASFDGRNHFILKPGDAVCVSISLWAAPTIMERGFNCEWFQSITSKLNWNVDLIKKSC